MYRYPGALVQIFCKTPLLGRVKTRLTPALSNEDALALHLELSRRTLEMATKSGLCPVELWCAPTCEHVFFTGAAQRYGVRLREQQGRDLGARMLHALSDALASYTQAVLIGCDCPSLSERDLEMAIIALQDAPAVFAPAEDGGYVLVGMSRPLPEVFNNMPWGTSDVMAATRARLAASGLRHVELAQQWDVDTVADYARYRSLPG